jgi:Tol biopolymer transport system component
MTDFRDRFHSLDRVRAPELWSEVIQRAAVAPAPRRWRLPTTNRLVPFALVATVVVLVLFGVGIFVRPPNVGPEPPAPTASLDAVNPEPSPSHRVGSIAYVAESWLSRLYLVRPGEEPVQLAPSDSVGNAVVCPSFSPDGSMLAFGMPGSIVVMSIDNQGQTGDATRLDDQAGETPPCAAWAPDSSAVAFLDGSALVVAPMEGESQRIDNWDVDTNDGNGFDVDYPADRAVQWSPDGSAIAVARPSGTWLVRINGEAPRRLHETPAYSVSWSPDATRLVVGVRGPKAIVVQAADGMTLADLPTGFGPPTWSPVEERIAFSDADARLVVVRPDGTDRLVIDDYGYHPTWSGDGQHLLYIQDAASAAWRLMMADASGSGEPTTIVDSVAVSSARSFPAAEQISWQPVEP